MAELSGGGSKKEDGGVGDNDGRERTLLDARGVARLELGITVSSRVASEAGVGGGSCGWLSSGGKMIGEAGGDGTVDERSYDNNEPSKNALVFDLVIISLLGSVGRAGSVAAGAEERRIDFRELALL